MGHGRPEEGQQFGALAVGVNAADNAAKAGDDVVDVGEVSAEQAGDARRSCLAPGLQQRFRPGEIAEHDRGGAVFAGGLASFSVGHNAVHQLGGQIGGQGLNLAQSHVDLHGDGLRAGAPGHGAARAPFFWANFKAVQVRVGAFFKQIET